MDWTNLHGPLLARTFEQALGEPLSGFMAFVRCLSSDVVETLGGDTSFAPRDWRVHRVAEESCPETRTITADEAVEMRETKGAAVLLLVDTECAGAGMDGIYSAAREVDEASLFRVGQRLAAGEITKRHSAAKRRYAERVIKTARRHGGAYAISQWAEFDFLCRVARDDGTPGAHLHLLGLWPILDSVESDPKEDLKTASRFVDCLLGPANAKLAPAARIDTLRLDKSAAREIGELERFLHSVDTKPLATALKTLTDKERLWVGALRFERPARSIQGIELTSWRNRNNTIAKWSGLIEEQHANEPPVLILDPDVDRSGRHSNLEVKWKADPANLEKNAVQYRVSVLTDLEEELAGRDVPHAGRIGGEKCRFSDDDFSSLNEDSRLSAKVVVSVVGNEAVEPRESEEFIIRFGKPEDPEIGGVGTTVRAFSEGLVELGSREAVSDIAASLSVKFDKKGFALLRTPVERGRRKSFRVFRPPLIAEVEQEWGARSGDIGRWVVKVRGSGERAGTAEFLPLESCEGPEWKRAATASRKMARHFGPSGGVGQIHDDAMGSFVVIREYLIAWAELLEVGDPSLAIANTVEVQSLSGRTIGLIVLPAHPLRVAWHAAYDNLVLHTAFEQGQKPKDIRDEFAGLDGAMFPACLPNVRSPGAFVFADALGFHAVGMVPDDDREPKAAIAILGPAP